MVGLELGLGLSVCQPEEHILSGGAPLEGVAVLHAGA